MSSDTTVPPPSDRDALIEADARYEARQVARYDARRLLWKVTNLRSVAYCGRVVRDKTAPIEIKVTGTPGQPGARAGFTNLQTCGSVWACPVCSEKVNAVRQGDVEKAVQAWRERGGTVLFGTFTVRHHRGQALKPIWDAVSPAWSKVTSGASWHGGTRSVGDKSRFGIAGWCRVVEVKYAWKHGWHPHIHALFFLEADLSDKQVDDLRHRLFGRWERELVKRGYSAEEFGKCDDRSCADPSHTAADGTYRAKTHDKPVGVDLRRVTDDQYIADYIAKNGYKPAGKSGARGVAFEVTGSHAKKAGKGGRTPFDVLASLVLRDNERVVDGQLVDVETGELLSDSREQDLAIWLEWEQASKGRRQLTWSRGLRDLVGLDADELTDEEIAEQELDGAVSYRRYAKGPVRGLGASILVLCR